MESSGVDGIFLESPLVIFSGETSTCRKIYAIAFFTNIVIVWTKESYHDCVYQQSLIETTGIILIRDLFRNNILTVDQGVFLFFVPPGILHCIPQMAAKTGSGGRDHASGC